MLVIIIGVALTAVAVGAMTTHARRESAEAEAAETGAARASRAEAADRERAQDFAASVRVHGVKGAGEGLLELQPWASRRHELDLRDQIASRNVDVQADEVKKFEEAVKRSRLPQNLSLAMVAVVFWAAAAALAWRLESMLIFSQGYPSGLAMILGAVSAVVVEVLGLGVFAALGVHPIPLISDLPARARVGVAGLLLTAMATLLMIGVIPLTAARAEMTVGEELRSAMSVSAAVEEDPNSTSSEVTAAAQRVDRAVEQVDRAKRVDALLTVAVIMVVFTLSWAPLHIVQHGSLSVARRRRRSAQQAVLLVGDDRTRFDADFLAEMAEQLVGMGHSPRDVRLMTGESAPGDTGSPDVDQPRASAEPSGVVVAPQDPSPPVEPTIDVRDASASHYQSFGDGDRGDAEERALHTDPYNLI